MKKLKIEATIDTPSVLLDPEQNVFEFSGRSYPEDPAEFYIPVLKWLDRYSLEPNDTHVQFKLGYFNSSSYRPLYEIFTKLEKIMDEGCKVQAIWYFSKGDQDMLEAGKEFSEMVKVPFTFQSY